MVFTIAVIVFALSFVVAGRIQDKFGPLLFAGGRDAGEPGILSVLVHHQPDVSVTSASG